VIEAILATLPMLENNEPKVCMPPGPFSTMKATHIRGLWRVIFFHNNTFRLKLSNSAVIKKITKRPVWDTRRAETRSFAHHMWDVVGFQINFGVNHLAMFTTKKELGTYLWKALNFFHDSLKGIEHFLLLQRFEIQHRKINKIMWTRISEISGKQSVIHESFEDDLGWSSAGNDAPHTMIGPCLISCPNHHNILVSDPIYQLVGRCT
jgi:hypothetical protein